MLLKLVDKHKKLPTVMVLTLKNTAECAPIEIKRSQGQHADSR